MNQHLYQHFRDHCAPSSRFSFLITAASSVHSTFFSAPFLALKFDLLDSSVEPISISSTGSSTTSSGTTILISLSSANTSTGIFCIFKKCPHPCSEQCVDKSTHPWRQRSTGLGADHVVQSTLSVQLALVLTLVLVLGSARVVMDLPWAREGSQTTRVWHATENTLPRTCKVKTGGIILSPTAVERRVVDTRHCMAKFDATLPASVTSGANISVDTLGAHANRPVVSVRKFSRAVENRPFATDAVNIFT
jgi:hypothetical protein